MLQLKLARANSYEIHRASMAAPLFGWLGRSLAGWLCITMKSKRTTESAHKQALKQTQASNQTCKILNTYFNPWCVKHV